MKRNFDAKNIKLIIDNFIDTNSLSGGLNNVKIQGLWEKTMGSNINSYTTELNLKNKTLYVNLSSSVLRQELSYGKQKIINLLNNEIGETIINKIVLR
tara:strand:- start:148 stop:441 length:294 start_codon:yes stop_codon:yes gene_type:complete